LPAGPSGSGGPPGGGPGPGGSTPDTSTDPAEFRKYALMGDLAMKQHDYGQAVEAFRKATGVYSKLPAGATDRLELIEVATKLARALTAQGKLKEAENVIVGIVKMTDGLAGAARPDKPAEGKSEMALPGKLIITVPKKLLDGTNFDELKRRASVEYLTFDKPAAEKKQ
jgi:hypothetical protein